MNNTSKLLIYKASAGSGKTFTLASEYIKLLIQKPRAYREILAVTFTNKATKEMKERILSQLYGIAIGDSESEAYLQKIQEKTALPVEEIRQRATMALKLILHDYSHFRVETIDSFFQSVIKNLAKELNLGAKLKVQLNNDEALSDAVDTLISNLHQEENRPMLYWILDYIQERISDNKRWNVAHEIKRFGKHIFNEEYLDKGETLRKHLEHPDFIRRYKTTLKKKKEAAQETMKEWGESFFRTIEKEGFSADDFAYKEKGICSYFRKLKELDFRKDLRTTRVKDHLQDPNKWVNGKSPRREELLQLVETQLYPLLKKAEELRPDYVKAINSCNISLKYINSLQLLSAIDEEVHKENKEKNRFLLADTNALLRQFVGDEDSPFIFEKLGANLNHIMIDEFQDTSGMQWKNFRFLVLNGLAQGMESLIVGDVKQSIYRWRNGDWRILNSLKEQIGNFPIEEKPLTVNRRSAGNIVMFNNLFFQKVVHVVNENDPTLKDAYKDVWQDTWKAIGKGYVNVTLFDKNVLDYQEKTCEMLVNTVNELANQHGIGLKDMVILVRKNNLIPIIATYFDQHSPYKVVSNEAFQLGSSIAVNMLIGALRYLSQPDDRIAMAQLAIAYQQEVLHTSASLNDILLNNLDEFLPTQFVSQVNKLRLMPLYELLEKLFKLFGMEAIPHQDAYLCAFYDHVTDYVQENSSELSAFLTYWDEELRAKTIPSGEIEGIRILSVHRSKGLESHTVLLPFCDWNQENEIHHGNVLWVEPQEAPYNEMNILPVDYSKKMTESIYKDDYLKEQQQLWIDNLNLLYVAFTRAKSNLFILGHLDQASSVSSWIQETMELIANDTSGDLSVRVTEQVQEEGTDRRSPLIYEIGSILPSEKSKKKESHNKLLIPSTPKEIRIQSYESNIEFRQSNKSAAFIRGEETTRERYIQQGQVMHYLFSAIQTKDDIDNALQQLRIEGIMESMDEEKEARRLTERALAHPQVQDWYSGQWQLFNECAILYKEYGTLQTRRPDRVMMKGNEVVVVDFKFGKRKEEYHRQVKEYVSLLRQMGYQHVKGYLWYVVENTIEEV